MTSSQSLTTSSRSNRQNRDSFSDRLCDDLCEVILQFLSLKDKIKLEGVSKQFQRTIFQKQFEINLYYCFLLMKNQIKLLQKTEYLVKRCPKIKLFRMSFHWGPAQSFLDYNQIIGLITKYCNNLIEFNCNFNNISETVFSEFRQKFGPKVKSVESIHTYEQLSRLTAFPNLVELEIDCSDGPFAKNYSREQAEEYCGDLSYKLSHKQIKELIDKFKTLRHLTLRFADYEEWDNQYFTHISSLKQLIKLEVFGEIIPLSDESVFIHLTQMADNCPKLKSLLFEFIFNWDDFPSQLCRLLSALKAFKQLKRLDLLFREEDEELEEESEDEEEEEEEESEGEECDYKEEDITEMFSFEALEGLTNITHLNLKFSNYFADYSAKYFANEKMFTNIDINLPNVQKLEIGITLNTTPEGTTRVADILSRLSKLKSVTLCVSDETIKQNLSKELAQKCERIETITVETHE